MTDALLSSAFCVVLFLYKISWREWNRRLLLLSFGLGLLGAAASISVNEISRGMGLFAVVLCSVVALAWVSLLALYKKYYSPQAWVSEICSNSLAPEERKAPYTSSLRVLAGVLAAMLLVSAFEHKETASASPEAAHTTATLPIGKEIASMFPDHSISQWLAQRVGTILPVVRLAILAFAGLMLFHPLSHYIEHLGQRLNLRLGQSRMALVPTVLLFSFIMSEHFFSHSVEHAIELHGWGFCISCLALGALGPAIATYYWMRAMQIHPRANIAAPFKGSVFMAFLILSPVAVPLSLALCAALISFIVRIHGTSDSVLVFLCAGPLFAVFNALIGFLIVGPDILGCILTMRFGRRLPLPIQLLFPVLLVTLFGVIATLFLGHIWPETMGKSQLDGNFGWLIAPAVGWFFAMLIDAPLHKCIRDYSRHDSRSGNTL